MNFTFDFDIHAFFGFGNSGHFIADLAFCLWVTWHTQFHHKSQLFFQDVGFFQEIFFLKIFLFLVFR
jgi:hypothetical protein